MSPTRPSGRVSPTQARCGGESAVSARPATACSHTTSSDRASPVGSVPSRLGSVTWLPRLDGPTTRSGRRGRTSCKDPMSPTMPPRHRHVHMAVHSLWRCWRVCEVGGREPKRVRAALFIERRGAREALRCGASVFGGPESATLTAAPVAGKGSGVSERCRLTLPQAVRTVEVVCAAARRPPSASPRAGPPRERALS